MPRSPSSPRRPLLSLLAATLLIAVPAEGQTQITTPRQQFGFSVGDDYQLANYTQFAEYWQKLAQESPRLVLRDIGSTAEGRPQYMAIITSPENHGNLERYRDIAARLARADGVTEEQARRLAAEGKAVVWIDGGLHATEVLGAHQLMETVYQLVSRTDAETMRFLDDVVILAVHANPDGMELVSNWYMREPDPTKRSSSGIPRLYQKYVGHDNNRDFFLGSQPETENMLRIMFHEWFPQIVYNHHQTGPAGTVLFAPPFRDPFNYNLDPLIPLGIDMIGSAMHSRFAAENKPGATMRSGASYSTWWNGGLRTITYFHNMLGLLTETIGNPTPVTIPFVLSRHLPKGDIPFPVEPQQWHFRQSIDYSVTANRAVLDYASRYRETLLYRIYLMGRNSIERGNRDHWTIHPKRIDAVREAAARGPLQGARAEEQSGFRRRGAPARLFTEVLRDPAMRDARGYILPANQADFPTAAKFVNALIKNGITIHRATADFSVLGKRYPAGSFVVKTAQAFRPHILDMFEPQDHPNDFAYPGGPPIPPYDNAGWTLAYQMGVEFDRIIEGFDGPFEPVEGFASPPPGTVANASSSQGFLLGHEFNDAFVVMNRLLKDGEDVHWLSDPLTANGKAYPVGTMFIPRKRSTTGKLESLARELGVRFDGVSTRPEGRSLKMRPVRVGLWDRYGGSMPSGWARWLLEQFEFPFEVVYPQALADTRLSRKYDVLVFVNGAIPPPSGGDQGNRFRGTRDLSRIPAEFHDRVGSISADTTIPALRKFLEDGGTMITIGSSTNMGYHLGLPIESYLVDETGQALSRDEYYMPGSIHQIRLDNTRPIAWGLPERVNIHFNNSPVFKLAPDAEARGVRRVGWFDSAAPLMSGWAWGQEHLENGVTIAEADVGRGKLYLFGPEIIRRGQPHGSFKFLFNGIYLSNAEPQGRAAATGGGGSR